MTKRSLTPLQVEGDLCVVTISIQSRKRVREDEGINPLSKAISELPAHKSRALQKEILDVVGETGGDLDEVLKKYLGHA